jgi:hypothetical protein
MILKKNLAEIPYLNGGMFEQHQLEQDYKDIDIADEAFERLFDFFDKWRWHLDTRIEAYGKRHQPGCARAISLNNTSTTVLKWVLITRRKILRSISVVTVLCPSFSTRCSIPQTRWSKCSLTTGEVWSLLKSSGDQYIYRCSETWIHRRLGKENPY